jgi:hypothetical protein
MEDANRAEPQHHARNSTPSRFATIFRNIRNIQLLSIDLIIRMRQIIAEDLNQVPPRSCKEVPDLSTLTRYWSTYHSELYQFAVDFSEVPVDILHLYDNDPTFVTYLNKGEAASGKSLIEWLCIPLRRVVQWAILIDVMKARAVREDEKVRLDSASATVAKGECELTTWKL